MAFTEQQQVELKAATAIAVTYLREGINLVDAAHAAMRFLNWAPSDEHAALIMEEVARDQHKARSEIYRELVERVRRPNVSP